MKALITVLVAALAVTPGFVQEAPAPAPVPALASDHESIDAILAATYAVISGPAGPRDWERFEALFHPGARLMAPQGVEPGAELAVRTPAEYAVSAAAYLEGQPFYEREIARRSATFGRVTHVFSTYEVLSEPGGEPTMRGINSFQLYWDEERWWVLSIFWDQERPDQPIPARYLKG